MSIFTRPVALFVTAASIGSLPAHPSLAFVSSRDPVPLVTAEVMPTPDQVQKALAQLSQMVQNAESVSIISPTAEREYIEAKSAFRCGNYLGALQHAGTAQRALPRPQANSNSR